MKEKFVDWLKKLIGLNESMEEHEDMETVEGTHQSSYQVHQKVEQPQPVIQQQVPQNVVMKQPTASEPVNYIDQTYQQHPSPQTQHISQMSNDFEELLLEDQRKKRFVKSGNIIDISTPPSNEMVIIEPKNLDDASRVVSLLRSKKAVIVSYMNSTLSQELKDAISNFICGAICAIDGNQEIITQQGVFLFTPGNININNLNNAPSLQRTVDKSANNLFYTINDVSSSKKKEKDSRAS